MEATYVKKERYYASIIINLLIGVFVGYIAGYKAALSPPLNPDNFKIRQADPIAAEVTENGPVTFAEALQALEDKANEEGGAE